MTTKKPTLHKTKEGAEFYTTRKTRTKKPKQPLMREFEGRTVVALRRLSNSVGAVAEGSRLRVVSFSSRGLDLTSESCSCCGVRLHILHVRREDVQLLGVGVEVV